MTTLAESLTIKCDTHELAKVRLFVVERAQKIFTNAPSMPDKIMLAVDEAVANVMEHAYVAPSDAEVKIAITADEHKFIVEVFDEGKQFNPLMMPEVEIHAHVKQGKRGGLGVFIIRKVMDEVEYNFVEGRYNVLKMVKNIAPKTP